MVLLLEPIRQRVKRRELCEQLTLGGFLSRPDFEQLQSDVNDIYNFMQGEP